MTVILTDLPGHCSVFCVLSSWTFSFKYNVIVVILSVISQLQLSVYCTLVDCNLLTLLLRFVLDLSYKLFLHCYAAVGKILTVAELFVNIT